jgi:adenine deaminase
VAILNVNLVDVQDGSLVPEQSVLIRGNRIVSVGRAGEVRIPFDAELVPAAGRYLIPGLWDMHVHSVQPVDPARPTIPPQDWHLPLFLAYGVTGVRNMNDGTGDVRLG